MNRALTKGELSDLEREVVAICETIDLCVEGRDDDVLENLDRRLSEIDKVLKNSLDTPAPRHLKVV